MRLLSAYTKKYSYNKQIYFIYIGEPYYTEKGVHIHCLNSSHACHASQNHVYIFLFESNIYSIMEYSKGRNKKVDSKYPTRTIY